MRSPYPFEWFDSRERSAAEQLERASQRVSEDRTKYFQRLALLCAGSVVLSVSLLSTVFGKTVIHGIAFLFAGWAAFVVSLMSSLFTELKYHRYLLESSMSNYQSKLADKKIFLSSHAIAGNPVVSEPQDDGSVRQTTAQELRSEAHAMREAAKKREGDAARLFKAMTVFEMTAITGFVLGVFLLAVFAGINVTLGAGHRYLK